MLLMLAAVSAAAGTARGFDWEVSTIDPGKWFDSMGNRSLVLDSSGNPQIAYGGRALYNAWHDGSTWQTTVVDEGPGVGRYASIALPAGSGSTRIGYLDEANGRAKYAQWISRGFPAVWFWQVETVDVATNGSVTLALDSAGAPRLLYRSPAGNIRYAYKTGATWTFETVYTNTTADTQAFADMMIDSAGRTHVVFARGNHALTHARRELNGTWTRTTFGMSESGESYPALALDAADRPHVVSARNATTPSMLVYYHHDGTNWQSEALWATEFSVVARHISAAMRAGKLHISYYDPDLKTLEHYNVTDSTGSTIASGTNVGLYSSIALNASGEPRVSYYHAPQEQLIYASHAGTTWSKTVVDQAKSAPAGFAVAADAAGGLHATWVDTLLQHLRYAKQAGALWTVTTVDDAVAHTSLKINSGGNPCVSYCGSESNTLRYASYLKAGPLSFWMAEDVDTAGGWYSSLSLTTGNWPRISYIAGGNLKYAYKDTNGWHLTTVDNAGSADSFGTSLAPAPDGTMSIAYGRGGVLRYAYSIWSHGTLVWMPPQVVATNSDVAIQPALAFNSDGQPCIGFAEDMRGARFAWRDGNGWHVQNVDTSQWCSAAAYAMDEAGGHYLAYKTGNDQLLRHAFGYGTPTNLTWRLQPLRPGAGSWNLGLAMLAQDAAPHVVFSSSSYERDALYARGIPLRLTGLHCATNPTVQLCWGGESNGVEVQRSTSLSPTSWTAVAHNLGGTNCILGATNPAAFYRLRLE
jgi:hypothetical protein